MTQRLYNKPNISNDKKLTGWYKTNDKEQVALRVGDNQLEIEGTIRFHNGKFQGFNGHTWVELNAEKGDIGSPGKDFNQLVSIQTNHEIVHPKSLKKVSQADVNITTETTGPDYQIQLRNLKAGKGINLLQNNNTIQIENQPQNFVPDITNSDVTTLKQKCQGNIEIYAVAPNHQIKQGEAVQLVNINNKIFIKTISYNNQHLNLFNSGISMLGVALNDAKPNQKCAVCTRGICNVLIDNDSPYNSSVSIKINNVGVVSRKGGITNCNMKPIDNFISAGYFLEEGNLGTDNKMVLFYVDPKIHYF